MSVKLINNLPLKSKHNSKRFISDFRYQVTHKPKPLIIFVHGLKGFKDWGHWNLIADKFANSGFVFAKLNLSHNGTTPEHPIDFADLEAFGKNNFSIELDDIGVLIDFIFSTDSPIPKEEVDLNKVFIIGHSRGGGLVALKANEDDRIRGVITWAAVDDYGARWSAADLEKWKEKGIRYMYNGRTKQDMPQEYQIVEDYWDNQDRLNIKNAVSNLNVPCLFVHGSSDETVKLDSLENLLNVSNSGTSHIIEGANHVFGGKHPYTDKTLPVHSEELVDTSISWINKF